MKLYVVQDIYMRPRDKGCLANFLEADLKIVRLALNTLCECPDLTGKQLHKYLYNGAGLDAGVQKLKNISKEPCYGLGYSAGGTALWRAAALGMPLKGVFCISSTRLRDEQKITQPHHVFFGSLDPHKPSQNWLNSTPERFTILKDAKHNYYHDTKSPQALETCQKISTQILELENK